MRKILPIAALFLLLASPGWAADYYVASTGDNGAGTSWATAKNALADALPLVTASGDTVWLEDETHAGAALQLSTALTGLAAGEWTLRSRSGDYTLCIIDGGGANIQAFGLNKANITSHFRGFTLQNVAKTTSGVGGFQFSNGPGGSFTDVLATAISFTADAGLGYGLVVNSDDDAGRTLTFNNFIVRSCPVNAGTLPAVRTIQGLISLGTGTSVAGAGVTFDQDALYSTGANEGLFSYRSDLNLTTVAVTSNSLETESGQSHACINNRRDVAGAGTTTIGTLTQTGNTGTTDSGDIRGVGSAFHGPTTITTLVGEDNEAVTTSGNVIGCTLVSYGAGDVTIGRSTCRRNTSNNGPDLYASQGGSISCSKHWSEDGTANIDGGSVYSGGWGHIWLDYFVIKDSTAGDQGGAIYGHNHSGDVADKEDRYYNGVIYNCAAVNQGDGAFFNNAAATHSYTVNAKNLISSANATWGSGTDELSSDAGTVFNVSTSCINGGAAAVTNEDDFTGSISGNPLFGNAAAGNFKLKPTSPCINTGTPIVGLTTDYLGKAIVGNPEIGAYEYRSAFRRMGGWK